MFTSLSIGKQANAEPVTIAILGDSLVQGYGLIPEDGFVPQLQRKFTDEGAQATFLNAGVSGDTTAGGLARVNWALGPDVDGVIISLGGNDILRGFDPSFSQGNLRSIMEITVQRGLPVLLIGISTPSNYGEEYKADFDAIYPKLSGEFGTLLYPNFLATLFDLPDRSATLGEFMQADRIHPNAKGVTMIVDDMAPVVRQFIQRLEEAR